MGTQARAADVVVKTIGASGQISLGKEFAGRQVTVERLGDGRWTVVEVDIIPKHERIFHTPEAKASAQRSAEWLAKNPVKVTTDADLDALEKELFGGKEKGKKTRRKTLNFILAHPSCSSPGMSR